MPTNSNDAFLQEEQKWIEAIPDSILDKLSSLKQEVRKKAFLIIEQTLQNNLNMLLSVPMSFLQKQDIDAAISFLIASLENKKPVSFEVLEQVYQYIITELEIVYSQNDQETIEIIEYKLQLLILLLEKNQNYMQDESFLNLLYDEKMRLQLYEEAWAIAQKLIEKNHPEWYILLWLAYKYAENNQKAIQVFLDGWNHFQTLIHIENIIITSYEIGNLEWSKKWYQLWLSLFPKDIGFFIEYSLDITSWEEFEIFAQEIMPNTFSDVSKRLLEKAIQFLQEELITEEKKFSDFKQADIHLVWVSLFESLKIGKYLFKYTQDIQYVLYHIYQLQTLFETQDKHLHEAIREFLELNYPLNISEMVTDTSDDEENENYKISKKNANKTVQDEVEKIHLKISLEEHLYLYIVNSIKTFVSSENQWSLIAWIFPFLEKISREVPEYKQIIMDTNYLESLKEYMFREEDFLSTLSEEMRGVYKLFLENVDEKYGLTARRNIEFYIKNSQNLQEFENEELLLFQIVKTCIHNHLIWWLNSEKVYEIFEKNDIFSLPVEKDFLLLLWEILFKSDKKEAALDIFTHTHIHFQDDISLYYVLKISYMFGQKVSSEIYKKILLWSDFQWNIVEYVYEFIQEMKSSDDRDLWNEKYLFLLEAMYYMLFSNTPDDIEKCMNLFQWVFEMGDPEWMWWIGKIYEAHTDLKTALWCYYEAFLSQEIKNPLYLKECFKISFQLEDKASFWMLIEDSKKYFSHRGFEWEYFTYIFEYQNHSQALLYFIQSMNKNSFSISIPDILNVKIKFLASKKDNHTYEEYYQTLLAQGVEMLKSNFQLPYQILFLKTLSELPEEFSELLMKEILELFSESEIYSSESLLEVLENFAQNISQQKCDDSLLPMIRDFYYLISKVFHKIPWWEVYEKKYIKKMDIPYVSWNFLILPHQLSSSLYH